MKQRAGGKRKRRSVKKFWSRPSSLETTREMTNEKRKGGQETKKINQRVEKLGGSSERTSFTLDIYRLCCCIRAPTVKYIRRKSGATNRKGDRFDFLYGKKISRARRCLTRGNDDWRIEKERERTTDAFCMCTDCLFFSRHKYPALNIKRKQDWQAVRYTLSSHISNRTLMTDIYHVEGLSGYELRPV